MNQSKGRLLTSFLCYVILHKSSFKHSLIRRLCFNPLEYYSHIYYSAINTFFFSSVNISASYDINISKHYLMQHFCTISKPHIFSKNSYNKSNHLHVFQTMPLTTFDIKNLVSSFQNESFNKSSHLLSTLDFVLGYYRYDNHSPTQTVSWDLTYWLLTQLQTQDPAVLLHDTLLAARQRFSVALLHSSMSGRENVRYIHSLFNIYFFTGSASGN